MSGGKLAGLTAKELGGCCVYLPQVTSTNDYLKENGDRLPHGTLCYTANQTAGRGRQGRAWTVRAGQSLAMSLLFRPGTGLERLPLVCGLAGVRALTALTDTAFRIKWPNDIVCSGQKVCGILCESRFSGDNGFVVAGMGFNLLQSAEEFAAAGLPHAASVRQLTGRTLRPEQLAAAVVNELEPLWHIYRDVGFRALRNAYRDCCVNLGQQVRVLSPDGTVRLEGTAVDIDEDGCLVVKTADGLKAVEAGEVSVRGKQGYV